MSRTTLCAAPKEWEDQVKNLSDQGLPITAVRTLFAVELCFRLVECLKLDSYETVGVVPALLSGVPLYDEAWDENERHAIANTRQIASYASTTAWRNALEVYAGLPEHWRFYQFPDQPIPELNADADEEESKDGDKAEMPRRFGHTDWFVCNLKKLPGNSRNPDDPNLYERVLTTELPFHLRGGEAAKPGDTYEFTAANPEKAKQAYKITFPQKLPILGQAAWFPGATRPQKREPIPIHLRNDLNAVALFLDEADTAAKRKTKNWQARLSKIRYRRVTEEGEVDESDPDQITLNGFHHAAGMVASGKSTLSFLLAAWVILFRPKLRITIVVGDVQSSLRFADELNTYFCADIETDTPVAVPLLGRRTRDKHLRDLHGSRDYHERHTQGKGHWGERFLSTVCPLQSLVPELSETPLSPGEEPCSNLRPLPGKKRKGAASDDPERPSDKRFLCPLYKRCPVQQIYHDMEPARVWITTPWAMAYGSLPRQVEKRPVHFGEIIYEHSDIVVFDEADTVMGVFDEVFAEVAELSNGKDAIYDRIGTQTERFAIGRRSDAGAHRMRWSNAQRSGQDFSMALLSLLTEPETAYLRRWLERTQFTPHSLMLRLVRMVCGLVDFPRNGDELDSDEDKENFKKAFEPFRLLFERGGDPLRQRHLSETSPDPDVKSAYFLWRLLIDISAGANVFGDDLLRACKDWLKQTYPTLPASIEKLNARRKRIQDAKKPRRNANDEANRDFENIDRIAQRLVFTLTAALLDRSTDIVLYEWHSRAAPDEDDVEPHRRMPAVLRDILPQPPTGQQFGTYFAPGDDAKRNTNRLSYLSYTNIGRWYLLYFHCLRTDLDGKAGPHVLALSGTSYLPDSVRLHVGTKHSKPQGLLLPEEEAMHAIGASEFRYLPLVSKKTQKALRISGLREWEKRDALVSLSDSLAGGNSSHLAAELTVLDGLGSDDPKHWADRTRLLILVNSYDQAKTVGDALRQSWRDKADRIYHLARTPKSGEGDDLVGGSGARNQSSAETLLRTDIETFAQTNGQVLVAPISAIGRGFNILNRQDPPIAAFGAVYFLIRPYPHPDDMTALAREINRRTLDWAEWPEFSAWNPQNASIEAKFHALRGKAKAYWHDMERRKYYSTLHDRPDKLCEPRKDLAAFTAGIIVQAVGRLLRGGVPFHAFFCDAAFAPNTANWYCESNEESESPEEPDAPVNSLLAAVIDLLREQVATDAVARMLYEPLANALCDFRVGVAPNEYPFEPRTNWRKQERKR